MTAPTLSARAEREQRTFRILLDCMARPGRIGRVALHERGGRFAAALSVLESMLDHEVTFAVSPVDEAMTESLLRYTGSRSTEPERADYLLGFGEGRTLVLQHAKPGSFEYPDHNGTVVLLVKRIAPTKIPGLGLTLSGPGVQDRTELWVGGLTTAEIDILRHRNSAAPLGVDVVLATPDGEIACLPRYTQIETTGG